MGITDEEMLRDSAQLYGFAHDNISTLLGFVLGNGDPYALFEWADCKFYYNAFPNVSHVFGIIF